MLSTILAAEPAPTAGGAAFDEILIAAGMSFAVMAFFGWVVLRERQGKTTLVGRLADWAGDVSGLPRWAALPIVVCIVSLLTAGFGVWWDVPIHMQNGRDEGPLANPSHYFIFLGILGFLHAGILSMGLARDPLPQRTLKISDSWRVPMGALPMVGAGLIALAGFPADDLWHRLFGQDVTEWGPTHVMMIGGAVTCCLGVPLLLAESHQVGLATGGPRVRQLPFGVTMGTGTPFGRLLFALSIGLCMIPIAFLMEFDLGVPQFPAATQFIIFGFIAAWICTAVRNWYGPGGALIAAALYLAIHGFLYFSVLIPLDDVLTGRFLLFVPSAVIVELVALAFAPRRKPLAFALVSGLLVGSVGMYAEWLWSDVFMPLPQPIDDSALPLMLAVGTGAAVGGGLLGLWHVSRLREVAGDPDDVGVVTVAGSYTGWRRQLPGFVGIALFFALMAGFAPPSEGDDEIAATVEYSDVTGGGAECPGTEERCEAVVTVTFEPADAVEDAAWFYALAWQGRGPGGKLNDVTEDPVAEIPGVVRVAMEPTGEPGEYRSEHALPLYGEWKTLLRIHTLPRTMTAVALHAPDDPAIESVKGREIVVTNGETVDVVSEKQFLQREVKDDVPTWLWALAYSLVIASWVVLVLFFGWCYSSAARGARAPAGERETVPA